MMLSDWRPEHLSDNPANRPFKSIDLTHQDMPGCIRATPDMGAAAGRIPGDKPVGMWLTPGMLVGTHALLPVGACLVVDNLRLAAGLDRFLPRRSLWWVGVFGVLPDLFSPHLSLAARFASRSHSVVFLVGAIILAAAAGSFFENGRRLMVAVACWCAVVLHLAADALSGGIVPGYPVPFEVVGGAYIPFRLWIWCDLGLLGVTWWLWRRSVALDARRSSRN